MKPFEIYNEECLECMSYLPPASVDMVMADLPYQTTACKWDTLIPFDPLWEQYRRVCKKNAAIVLTASQPFTSALVMSNVKDFKYSWVWEKNRGTGFLDSKKRPLKFHEDVLVFYSFQPTYLPIKTLGKKSHSTGAKEGERMVRKKSDIYHGDSDVVASDESGMNYPRSVIKFNGLPPSSARVHPTQKPVALMEYLIKTYTNPGDVVLDNTMGSGTTGVACMNTGRRFIGIERDAEYFKIAEKRINVAWEVMSL